MSVERTEVLKLQVAVHKTLEGRVPVARVAVSPDSALCLQNVSVCLEGSAEEESNSIFWAIVVASHELRIVEDQDWELVRLE